MPELSRRWPDARPVQVAAAGGKLLLPLGCDTRLQVVAAGDRYALRIVDESTVLAGDATAAQLSEAMRQGVEWLAGARGFLQRLEDG